MIGAQSSMHRQRCAVYVAGVVAVAVCAAVALPVVAAVRSYDVTVEAKQPLFTTYGDKYLSFNVDAASLSHGFDWKSDRLRRLVARMAPAVLRVGGSAADTLYIGDPANPPPPPITTVITQEYFDSMVDFAASAGVDLVFDFNHHTMRTGPGPLAPWDSSNAQAVIDHLRTAGKVVYGWQLGNEPGHWNFRHADTNFTATQLGNEFVQLRKMVGPTPKLYGPDVCNGEFTHGLCATQEWFGEFLRAARHVLDGATVHFYPVPRINKTACNDDAYYLTPLYYERATAALRAWAHTAQEAAPGLDMILGETATTGDGGCDHQSNTYLSGFWWVNQLGQTAALGYKALYRQDFAGWSGNPDPSHYPLAGTPGWYQGDDDLNPHPDYFTGLVWKKVMGARVLATAVKNSNPRFAIENVGFLRRFRAFVHCANPAEYPAGAVALAYANLHDEDVEFAGLGAVDLGGAREEYILTAPSLRSDEIRLNGVRLSDDSPLDPAHTPHGPAPLRVAARTYGFYVWPAAKAEACL